MKTTKHSLRRLTIFLGIVALFPLGYFIYILFLQSDLYFSLHGVGDGSANIRTWLDTDKDGIWDQDETPLPNVCVGYVDNLDELIKQKAYACTPTEKTNSQGWGGSNFLPGWTGKIYKYAFPPEGYQPSTDMVSTDYYAEFGFVQKGKKVSQRVKTVDDYIRIEFVKRWIRYIAITFFILVTAIYGAIKIEKLISKEGISDV